MSRSIQILELLDGDVCYYVSFEDYYSSLVILYTINDR